MSVWKVRKFRELDEMNRFFSGGISGGRNISSTGQNIATGGGGTHDIAPLAGLTLVFTQPASHTVTFVAGADPYGRLQFAEVKTQIQAVMTTLIVSALDGKIALIESTPTSGVTLTSAGTANSYFGFDTNGSTVGKVYGTPFGSAPTAPYVSFAYADLNGMHVAWTFE